MRFLIIALCYIVAFAAFYAATTIAPDMKWPTTQIEYMAAQIMVIGAIFKIAGSVVLVTTK